jgi:ribosome-associated heat shock protein Hsp15
MQPVVQVRMDKWLWAVRLYKTRSVAASACTAGKVRISGQTVKPARSIRIGEIIVAATGEIQRTIRVVSVIERRVGAPEATRCYEDLTPPSEYAKPREPNFRTFMPRPKGSGRPTKKERREIDKFHS